MERVERQVILFEGKESFLELAFLCLDVAGLEDQVLPVREGCREVVLDFHQPVDCHWFTDVQFSAEDGAGLSHGVAECGGNAFDLEDEGFGVGRVHVPGGE